MKNTWIKVEDALPMLHYIHDNWSISDPVLVVRCAYVITASYEIYNGNSRWTGQTLYHDVTHWQPLELPDEEIL